MSPRPRLSSIRSLKASGIAGLLGYDCKVFHEVIFDTAGLGRVSDLLVANMKATTADEYSLRLIPLIATFGAARLFESTFPIRLEVGHDNDWFGVSVAFESPVLHSISLTELMDAVTAGETDTPLEAFLGMVCRNADYVFLKVQPSSARLEIDAIVRFGERQDAAIAELELVMQDLEPEETPPAGDYRALGDTDYSKLLKRRTPEGEEDAEEVPVLGEVLMHEARNAEELVRTVRGRKLEAASTSEMVRVRGESEGEAESDVVHISGSDAKPKKKASGIKRIFGWIGGDDEEDESDSVVIEGATQKKKPSAEVTLKKTKKAKSAVEAEDDEDLESQEAGADEDADRDDSESDESESEDSDSEEVDSDESDDESEGPAVRRVGSSVGADAGVENSALIKRIERELPEIKAELKSAKAERWVENLTAELTAERAKLIEAQKKLANSARLKELDFRNKENTLRRQLSQSQEQLKTKTSQVMRMKDQVSKLQMSLDQAKSGGGDEAGMKFKYNQAQKNLQAVRAEKLDLQDKLEALQRQVGDAMDSKRASVPVSAFEEVESALKKANAEIIELKRQVPENQVIEEQKKNMIVAQQSALKNKQRAEELEDQVREQKEEIERLQQELEQARRSAA